MRIQTYVTLEKALTRRLQRAWREQSGPTYAAITEACKAGDWNKARILATDLDMTEVGEANRQWIKYCLLSLAIFGAGMASADEALFLRQGQHDENLDRATSNILQYLERGATQDIQDQALQLIAQAQAGRTSKEDPYHDALGRFASGQAELEEHQKTSDVERLMVFDADSGEKLQDVTGEKHTVDRQGKLYNDHNVLEIHTHPNATSHSDGDWKSFSWSHVRESRVVAANHIYTLRKTKEWDSRNWQEHTPAAVNKRWNEILDEKTAVPGAWEVDTVSDAVNAQLAKELGAEFTIQPRVKKADRKYGNTQVDIPEDSDAASKLRALRAAIDDDHLAGDGKDIGPNHVTVRFGIQDEHISDLRLYIQQLRPFTATLGPATIFPVSQNSKGARPVVVSVEASKLHKIHEEIASYGNFAEPSFKSYKPHATLAYVDPDHAEKYKDLDGAGASFPVNSITINTAGGQEEEVMFGSKKAAAAEAVRFVKPFVSFADQGDTQLQLIASQNASRIATWGFTAEAEVRGITRYRLQAVLDGRTSKFCTMINGRTFDVSDARAKVLEVLSAASPEDAKTLQPWPPQDKASIERYSQMTDEELTDAGLGIPPYHPHCRTLCTDLGMDVRNEKPDIPDQNQIIPPSISTANTFQELGAAPSPQEVDHWNTYMGVNPLEVLSKLTGVDPKDLLEHKWKTLIKFLEDGGIATDAVGTFEDAQVQVGTIFDPYSGRFYLDHADFVAGDTGAEAKFLSKLLGGMIDVGGSIGASSVTINVVENAGAYVKLGFLPSSFAWDSLRIKWLDSINTAGILFPIYRSMSDAQRQLLIDILEDDGPDAATALINLNFKVGDKSIGEWMFEGITGTFSMDLSSPLAVSAAQELLDEE